MDDNTLDISIFCLSLMGSDWPMFLLEGTRCLKQGLDNSRYYNMGIQGHSQNCRSQKSFQRHQWLRPLHRIVGLRKAARYHSKRWLVEVRIHTLQESDFFVYCQFKLTKKMNRKHYALPTSVCDLLLPCPYKRR